MKICILLSSHIGTCSTMEEFDEYQNPGLYVKSHQFEQRFVRKENAKEKIDQIVREGFDYIWNFMWGPVDSNVAGVCATKYLETTNRMIGTSSKFLSMTKLDYKKCFSSAEIKFPKGVAVTGEDDAVNNLNLGDLAFPLIVKPSIRCKCVHITRESVCDNSIELMRQIKILKSKINHDVMIEEFVEGEEISVIILETYNGLIALEPIIYTFPEDWKSTRKFLNSDLKFREIERGERSYKIFDDDLDLVKNIKETGMKAYEALGVLGSGYARVHIRLKGKELFILKLNHTPAFFSKLRNTFGDDFVIETSFPGGHERFVDTIISSKIRFDTVIQRYNDFASTYTEILSTHASSHVAIWKSLIETFNFEGTVLDLGCGTGLLGKTIKEKYHSKITGIDSPPEMIKLATEYEEVHLGLIENVVFHLNSTFNHIVTSSALYYVDKRYFGKIFSRLFDLATNSISLTVEDLNEEYLSLNAKDQFPMIMFNHVDTIKNFQIPLGWSLVHKKSQYFWESPSSGHKVHGLVLRFENTKNRFYNDNAE